MKVGEISVDKIEDVVGGTSPGQTAYSKTKEAYCSNCRKIRVFDVYSGGRAYCRSCGKPEA